MSNNFSGCNCYLCKARAIGCDPMELMWPTGSIEARLVREHPRKPIEWYEDEARWERRFEHWKVTEPERSRREIAANIGANI